MEDSETPSAPNDFSNWKHLLYIADCLFELPKKGESLSEIRQLLGSVEEHFPRTLNPLDDFSAYTVRRFCMALRIALESVEEHPPPSLLSKWLGKNSK